MKILILSDVHIAANTPWSRDYEDINYTISQLKELRTTSIPAFDACILCGDIFNSPRLAQGDSSKFQEILDVLGLLDKPILAINGNHDPSGHHVCECLPGFHRLDIEPYLGIAGHSYSQDLNEIREWLKRTDSQITVTHQSCSMFMNLGNLDIDQLHPFDFSAPLNIIGDTHITACAPTDRGSMCISPGILCPMRSRAELLSAEPFLIWLEADYKGNGEWDLDNAEIESVPLKKRGALIVDDSTPESVLQLLQHDSDIPAIVYAPNDMKISLENSDNLRIIPYVDTVKELDAEVDYSTILEGSKTMDTILTTASQLLADDRDKPATLEVIKNLLETDQPADVAKSFLEGKVEDKDS